MQKSDAQSHTGGFALWKFVAVLALLFVTAAIFFPVFSPGRPGTAPKSSCQNNLKKIVLALKQYINDFDERYPLVAVTDAVTVEGKPPYGWADAIQPYIHDTEVYQCQSDLSRGLGSNGSTNLPNYTDYWYNANLVRRIIRPVLTKYTGANESMFGSSSQTIIAGDGGNLNEAPTGNARYNQCGDGSGLTRRSQVCAPQKAGVASFRGAKMHFDGANFAFVDGHVKWLRASNDSQSPQILSNATTQRAIGGKVTFSILNIP